MTATKLWSRGMVAVLCAQFLSALADNALLFGALAMHKAGHYPDWTAPLLQEFFVGAFILLAPFSGPVADSVPKGRVLFVANGLKLAGAPREKSLIGNAPYRRLGTQTRAGPTCRGALRCSGQPRPHSA
jgi:hypothetical protein